MFMGKTNRRLNQGVSFFPATKLDFANDDVTLVCVCKSIKCVHAPILDQSDLDEAPTKGVSETKEDHN